ncbi:MAG: ATPase [Planctomycetes bacterium]|nr:ATPase [Planctomycetota bacterium]
MTYVVGIDGGGTKTEAAVADVTGRILGAGAAGPSNHLSVGLEAAVGSVKEAVRAVTAAAGLSEVVCEVLCAGLAGVGRESDRMAMRPAIERLGLSRKVLLDHDAAIALAGATGCKPGVIVLAGTGSVAFGMNADGQQVRSGGLGHLLGDEGSAYWIGLRALNAAARALDGRGPETLMAAKLTAQLGASNLMGIVDGIYRTYKDKSNVAAFARLAGEAAAAGDRLAQEILAEAGRELALAANAVARRLWPPAQPFELAYAGGVFNLGEAVLRSFRDEVLQSTPHARIGAARHKPVVGAVMLALKEMGAALSDELLGRLGEATR